MRPENIELTNEVKKIGFMIERHSPVELRIGDTLIFYLSMGKMSRVRKDSSATPGRAISLNKVEVTDDLLRRSSYTTMRSDRVAGGGGTLTINKKLSASTQFGMG